MKERKQQERVEIVKRLRDYDADEIHNLQQKLVEKWRNRFPEAAAERSSYLKPLMKMEEHRKVHAHDPDEVWYNDVYSVTLRRRDKDPVFHTYEGMIQLGISSFDGMARHDWRDMQAIKNQLAGPEVEAFELYPAESRLLDPSNYYSLWCFPGIKRIKVGHEENKVLDADAAGAPQRAFPVLREHMPPTPDDPYCNYCGLQYEFWAAVPVCPADDGYALQSEGDDQL